MNTQQLTDMLNEVRLNGLPYDCMDDDQLDEVAAMLTKILSEYRYDYNDDTPTAARQTIIASLENRLELIKLQKEINRSDRALNHTYAEQALIEDFHNKVRSFFSRW